MRVQDSFDCHDGHNDRLSRNSCRVLFGKTGNTAKYDPDLSSLKNLRDLEVIEEAGRGGARKLFEGGYKRMPTAVKPQRRRIVVTVMATVHNVIIQCNVYILYTGQCILSSYWSTPHNTSLEM